MEEKKTSKNEEPKKEEPKKEEPKNEKPEIEDEKPLTREERMYMELGIAQSKRINVYIPETKGEDALPIGLNGHILLYKRGEAHEVPQEIFEIMERGRALR